MWRRTLIAVLVLGLFLAACTTGSDSSDNTTAEPPASDADTTTDADGASDETTSTDADETTASDTGETTTADTDDAASGDVGTSGGGATDLLGSVSPFDLLNNLGGGGASADVDPTLKQSLLDVGDLPPGFTPLGEFSFAAPSEYGNMEMVANMFMAGDLASADFGQFSMVMSAAVALPPEALEELGSVGDLESLISGDLDELEAEFGQFGEFADFELLDASGLGDGGFGMHIEMDFSALASGFGAPQGDLESAGIAMEMFAFFKGDQMLMTVTMWPTDQPADADAYELAELMDDKS